uniref:Uncharacterized protein n=2 Tax=Sus scrofa TaxID=9823 RepID=A0A8D0WRW5_PIG
MSCGVDLRPGSDSALLWLWRRLVATAPIRPLAWELPYAMGVGPQKKRKKIFSDPLPREMTTETKINKWDIIKLKSFCTAKETLNKTKRQHTEWEKIFSNEGIKKGLISKIYKHCLQHNIKKTNNLIKKGAEDLHRHFSKKTHRWPNNT